MSIKSAFLAAAVAASALVGAAGAANAQTYWDREHPRQAEVFGRVAREEHRIMRDRRDGFISGYQAARLMRDDRRVAREDRFLSHMNGGYITRGEQRALNRQENFVGRRLP
jgi:hypothetical protein